MKKRYIFLILLLVVISLTGCQQSVCGNGVIEGGEGCDNSECSGVNFCNEQCVCESIPEVPALPGVEE